MDKVFSMFRVFDIAFFAPGIFVWYVLSEYTGWITLFSGDNLQLTSTRALFQLAQYIGMVFLLGLLTHGTQRLLSQRFRLPRGPIPKKESWYTRLQPANREDLALYFWYLRATSYNMATACLVFTPIFIGLCIFDQDRIKWAWSSFFSILALLLFYNIGTEFHLALKNILPSGGHTGKNEPDPGPP